MFPEALALPLINREGLLIKVGGREGAESLTWKEMRDLVQGVQIHNTHSVAYEQNNILHCCQALSNVLSALVIYKIK